MAVMRMDKAPDNAQVSVQLHDEKWKKIMTVRK
jgi:hypothetical protein